MAVGCQRMGVNLVSLIEVLDQQVYQDTTYLDRRPLGAVENVVMPCKARVVAETQDAED